MALKERLNKKTAGEKVDDEIAEAVKEDIAKPVKASKKKAPAGKPYEGEVMMANIAPPEDSVSEAEGESIIKEVLTGLPSEADSKNTQHIESAIKTLLSTGGLSRVKDLLSQISKPELSRANFGSKWMEYPVCRIVALQTIQPNPSVSKFRVGGNDQDSFIKGKEFDVPEPVARHLANKGAAAILSTSE